MGALISLAVLALDRLGYMDSLERKTIDWRMGLTRAQTALPDDVAVVLIDDASLYALDPVVGRWPWPRHVHGELIDFLYQCGARLVVMDILFSERQKDCEVSADGLGRADSQLVEASRAADNVLYAFQLVDDIPDEYNQNLLNAPMPKDFIKRFSVNAQGRLSPREYNNFYLPYEELYANAAGMGVVTFLPDHDNVYRSEALVFDYQGQRFPSLGLAAAMARLGIGNVLLENQTMTIPVKGSTVKIPLQDDGKYYINMYNDYQQKSYSGLLQAIIKTEQDDLSNRMVNPEEFKDKVVFVGASAAAVEDLKQTSMGRRMPGVLLHAAAYANIMTGDFLRFAEPQYNILVICLSTFLTLYAILYLKKMKLRVLVPVSFMAGLYAVAFHVFNRNIVLPVASPTLAFLSAFLMGFGHYMTTEGREKRRIRNILGQYVSPAMLQNVLENYKEDYFKAEVGSKEFLTVFFSDIRGFTSLSEKLAVEKVVEMLNRYLSCMVNIIFQHQGTLDKFIGDAIVAFWGAPVKIKDHAYKAVLSALRMQNELYEMNTENLAAGLPKLNIGIGIHTGEVILGNIGSEKKLDYTVIGDSVNLTSRLEGLTKSYNAGILITQDTWELVREKIVCRMVDHVKVKGKDKAIAVFEVLGEIGAVAPPLLKIVELSEKAFSEYRCRNFQIAMGLFEDIIKTRPDDYLAHMFIGRCRGYLEQAPPDDWDGYYEHKTK